MDKKASVLPHEGPDEGSSQERHVLAVDVHLLKKSAWKNIVTDLEPKCKQLDQEKLTQFQWLLHSSKAHGP